MNRGLIWIFLPISSLHAIRLEDTDSFFSFIGSDDPTVDSQDVENDSVSSFYSLVGQIEDLRLKVANAEFPPYLREHQLYDSSAKQALIELATWLFENNVPVPLFQDRVTGDSSNDPSDPKPKICVSIASARRKGSPFSSLIQAVSAILNRMNYAKYKDEVYIHVFNVDSEPRENTEADIVKYFVPVSDANIPVELPEGLPMDSHFRENLDNAYIIRTFARIGCEHSIILEDDSLATNDWMDSVSLALEQLMTVSPDSWFMLRLYVAHSTYPPLFSRGINYYDPLFNMVACLLNNKYMISFAEELESNVAKAIEKRDPKENLPKDLAANSFVSSHGLINLAFEPVIFQHTGVYSSVVDRKVDEESVKNWIMFSEYFDAKGQPIVFNAQLWINQ